MKRLANASWHHFLARMCCSRFACTWRQRGIFAQPTKTTGTVRRQHVSVHLMLEITEPSATCRWVSACRNPGSILSSYCHVCECVCVRKGCAPYCHVCEDVHVRKGCAPYCHVCECGCKWDGCAAWLCVLAPIHQFTMRARTWAPTQAFPRHRSAAWRYRAAPSFPPRLLPSRHSRTGRPPSGFAAGTTAPRGQVL